MSPEAAQEYRISTNNFSAEYGRAAGYIADVVTLAGYGAWHGLAYTNLKNDVLNANEVHNMLGVVRQAEGKWARAEQEYRAAIDGNATSNAARFNLASLEMDRAKANPSRPEFAEAVKLWREIVDRDPKHVPSRLRLAEARVAEKNYSAAAEQYRLALKDRAGDRAIEAALAEALGDAAQQQGNLLEASEQYRSALERVRDTPAAKRIEEKLRHRAPARAAGH